MKTKPVICLGCAFWDTIFKVDVIPGHGSKVLPETAVQAASGMATAAAIAVARLGGKVEIWTRIGDDATGDAFVRDLVEEGIPTSRVRRVAGVRTPFSTILVDRNGERLVVPYTDPALDADPTWLPLREVADASAVLVDMRWPEGAEAILSEARRHGVPTVIDADIAPTETLRKLIALGDHVLFSEPALNSLSWRATPADALLEIGSTLSARVVGVTLGQYGALIRCHDDPPDAVRNFKSLRVNAVDTLNAGDVWHGAYVYGLASGWTLAQTVETANVAAGMKCERFGGRIGAPHLAEVLERMRAEGRSVEHLVHIRIAPVD
jgi:sulfofructose kinase